MEVVLSLFPGADLFGRAFEQAGFCVVRGPDVLWGGDVRSFHCPAGRFDGVIGGPPCQFASLARHGARRPAENLIPEFLRLVEEARPAWVVMENVVAAARRGAPRWPCADVCDWDVGGETRRVRRFWFQGIPPPLTGRPMPNTSDPRGGAHLAVIASSGDHGTFQPGTGKYLRLEAGDASARQGFPELASAIMEAQPRRVSAGSRRILAMHLLGNGVPLAMGLYVARHVARCRLAAQDRAG